MKNIVWLVSYPKSGNTWFRMFLANYRKKADSVLELDEIENTSISGNAVDFEENIGLNPFELFPDEVDLYRPDLYKIISDNAAEEDTIIKKTHDAYTFNKEGIPIFPHEITRCAVCLVRNPLDICVSYANHGAKNVKRTVDLIVNEQAAIALKKKAQLRQILLSWQSHVQSWKNQTQIPVHFARYEDMLQDPINTFGNIIRFLGLEYDKERLKLAIKNSDFKTLQHIEKEKGFRERMQMCQQFFWKGKIGNYKDYLTDEQIQRIVEHNYDAMKEFGYIDEHGKLTV